MKKSFRKTVSRVITHMFLMLLGFIMIYPLIWLVFASFKTNSEIFSEMSLFPREFRFENYVSGWKGSGAISFRQYFINTFLLVVPTVAFTVASSLLVAYSFARFQYPGRKLFFLLMLSTMMLPSTVVLIPRFMVFYRLNLMNSYWPFYLPAIFASAPFFVFLFYQFIRGVPVSLDEAATIDGCGSFRNLMYIILPLSKAAMVSAVIFQFIWTWNDYFNALIYINSVSKYTVSLGLRLMVDSESATSWDRIMAMSVVSMIPGTILYFLSQKYLVQGIATTGMKM